MLISLNMGVGKEEWNSCVGVGSHSHQGKRGLSGHLRESD